MTPLHWYDLSPREPCEPLPVQLELVSQGEHQVHGLGSVEWQDVMVQVTVKMRTHSARTKKFLTSRLTILLSWAASWARSPSCSRLIRCRTGMFSSSVL